MDKLIIPTLKSLVMGVVVLGLLLFPTGGHAQLLASLGADRRFCAGLERYRRLSQHP